MDFWKKITRSNFLIRLKSWEYWPFGIVQFPAILYWIWLSLRARSLVFFTASNPGIPMGGMFGESKYEILKNIPARLVPPTILLEADMSVEDVMLRLQTAGLQLPVIFKPDIGERGFMVKRINDEKDIRRYLKETHVSFLAQELVREKLEFGVFYMRIPDEKHGYVISVVGKDMLSVIGDGTSTLQQLILSHDRAKLQWKKLKDSYSDNLAWVVPAGQTIELVSIGNHALGTRFIDANHLINERLSCTFDAISRSIPGFYFGRYDLRCASVEDLYSGNVKILELNGCGAEPVHIYDTAFSLREAIFVLLRHWRYIFVISRANQQNGVSYLSHREALGYYRKFKSASK
jgi:hypothetical protein